MAQSRYIEKRQGDTWKSVSSMFFDWLNENGLTHGLGWSEGDTVKNDGREFFCLMFPDKYGNKIEYFEFWAETTNRMYGLRSGQIIEFPQNPGYVIELPATTQMAIPPWLK